MLFSEPKIPQLVDVDFAAQRRARFSALQRAENSSIRVVARAAEDNRHVSVLFSEPKIPQYKDADGNRTRSAAVSVLFSEPKIPQSKRSYRSAPVAACFSALQRAENSSIQAPDAPGRWCSRVSVLFSEPKIPQSRIVQCRLQRARSFSALQRAENSSM